MTRTAYLLCCLALLAVAATGCGADSGASRSGNSVTSAPSTTPASASETTGNEPAKGAWGVAFAAEGEDLGIILYDLSGHTLYTFSKDENTASNCYGACAKAWPPALTEGRPEARGGASPAKVGATNRKDGTVQLTYADHPLYTYADDRSGESSGNGVHAFGGEWHAIRPNGERP